MYIFVGTVLSSLIFPESYLVMTVKFQHKSPDCIDSHSVVLSAFRNDLQSVEYDCIVQAD